MKKITFSLVLLLISTVFAFAVDSWQKLDLTKVGGGTININIKKLELFEGKLYAATHDGIWVSPSANGGDWEAYGLQGQKVYHLCFGAMKLANAEVPDATDATKVANKLYKYNGSSWVLTNLNPQSTAAFNGANASFAQIQDGANNTVILYPTWGNGIWRSADGGDTWTNIAQETVTDGIAYKNVVSIRTFPGNNVVYGTDKVSNNVNYMIWSTDYGVTWQNLPVGAFFNPYSILVRKVNGKEYIYYGGQNGSDGVLWCSMDGGISWQGSSTAGVEFWEVRKIIGDDDGKVYTLNSVTGVFVSQLNNATAGWDLEEGLYNETFAPAAPGIIVPKPIPTTVIETSGKNAGYFYLSDIVKSSSKIYVSAIINEGIYYLDLNTAVNNPKENNLQLFPNPAQNELVVTAAPGSNISIYTVTGRLVRTVTADNIKSTIDIKKLIRSIYIVKAVSVEGLITTNRFVKK